VEGRVEGIVEAKVEAMCIFNAMIFKKSGRSGRSGSKIGNSYIPWVYGEYFHCKSMRYLFHLPNRGAGLPFCKEIYDDIFLLGTGVSMTHSPEAEFFHRV
jgi:hypothetical protein